MSCHPLSKKSDRVEIGDIWINFQKKHEFNPEHTHSLDLSFVIYLQIPDTLIEENKNYKEDKFIRTVYYSQTKDNKMPFSAAIIGTAYGTYMTASSDELSVTSFPEMIHRFNYAMQLSVTRKFHPRISVALMPSYVHRNLVNINDQNGLFSLGGAANIKVTKSIGLIAEYFYNINTAEMREDYFNSLSFGLEWITNGHNFTLNFTNARGFGELQYIALNTADWSQGQFRFGFTITRTFKY
jgi:hypothetical protein